jgi:cytochrome c-type biogenesis protein CcmF
VENASLVPWLATAALTHGMLLQRGRKRFRRLNLVLAVMAYLLVVYATFLTRSGVLGDFSVHSFVDLGITGWLVFNMFFFLAVSIGLLAWRWREIPTEVGDEPFLSRTIFFVVGIILLILIGGIVLVGTSAPLISRLWGEPAQVGPDFYNRVGYWLALAFAVFLGATPFLGWGRAREGAGTKFAVSAVVTLALLVGGMALGLTGWRGLLYVGVVLFCIIANTWALYLKGRQRQWKAAGGVLSHVGIGLMMLAFLTTGWLDREAKVRLKQDQPQEILGYTLTFKGVEKPTPMARDAMVVEVTDPRGRNFVMKPRMWVNQKSNQLVANPDIKSFVTRDLYLAPVEFQPGEEAPASGRLLLAKGEPAAFKDWTLTFQGFDLSRQNAVPGALTVGVVVEVEQPGEEPVQLEPSMISMSDGTVQSVAVDIPGTPGGRLRATGMSVDQGLVRVELLGLGGGIARTVVLQKGETLTYEGLGITFADFDLSDFDPDAGKINFGVVFEVTNGDRTVEVVPTFRGGAAEQQVTPAVVPGTGGISLSVGRIDAENGSIQLQVFDPGAAAQPATPPSIVLDVSTKPLISLVWIGTLLVMAGVAIAIGLRRHDVASIPAEG